MQSIQIRNLKNKIQRHFDHRILFFQPKYESEIVHSSTKILEKETESADSTWPPSSGYLHFCPVPEDLTIFLQRMFLLNVRDNISPKNDRKMKSFAQDMYIQHQEQQLIRPLSRP